MIHLAYDTHYVVDILNYCYYIRVEESDVTGDKSIKVGVLLTCWSFNQEVQHGETVERIVILLDIYFHLAH